MEALLSLAFDNLSSYDGPKVKKGLKQVEGLLAQICLSSPADASPSKSSNSPVKSHHRATSGDTARPPKGLAELCDDPAFHEFFKLQEGFEWNVASRLVYTLDRLIAKGADGQNDLLILNALDVLQGVMLLHPPSKRVFAREQTMNLILDLIEPVNCPAIQCATLLTLVVALIDAPENTRTFEQLDGLLTITSLFKSRSTSRDVKLRLVEFIYFYLMPESPPPHQAASAGSPTTPGIPPRSPTKFSRSIGAATPTEGPNRRDGARTRTTEEKQAFLGRHLSNVGDLVKDLHAYTPFGGAVA